MQEMERESHSQIRFQRFRRNRLDVYADAISVSGFTLRARWSGGATSTTAFRAVNNTNSGSGNLNAGEEFAYAGISKASRTEPSGTRIGRWSVDYRFSSSSFRPGRRIRFRVCVDTRLSGGSWVERACSSVVELVNTGNQIEVIDRDVTVGFNLDWDDFDEARARIIHISYANISTGVEYLLSYSSQRGNVYSLDTRYSNTVLSSESATPSATDGAGWFAQEPKG